MRYIKRILIILFLVIMISGCSVDYRVKINKDLSVNEKAIVSERTDRMKSRTNLDVNQSVKYLYDIYKYDSMSGNNYSILSSGYTTKVASNNSYKNIKEYADSFQCDITESMVYYETDDYVHIEIDQTRYIDSRASTRPVYDRITVTFEVPYKVTFNNADFVNGNEYTWYIKADSDDLARILLEFNPDKVGKAISLPSFGFGVSKVHIGYEILIIIIIIILVLVGVLFAYRKGKKNNRM